MANTINFTVPNNAVLRIEYYSGSYYTRLYWGGSTVPPSFFDTARANFPAYEDPKLGLYFLTELPSFIPSADMLDEDWYYYKEHNIDELCYAVINYKLDYFFGIGGGGIGIVENGAEWYGLPTLTSADLTIFGQEYYTQTGIGHGWDKNQICIQSDYVTSVSNLPSDTKELVFRDCPEPITSADFSTGTSLKTFKIVESACFSELPTLPDSVETIVLAGAEITSISALPPNLVTLSIGAEDPEYAYTTPLTSFTAQIPESCTTLYIRDCPDLTGLLVVNSANLSNYDFRGTENIVLAGSCPQLNTIAQEYNIEIPYWDVTATFSGVIPTLDANNKAYMTVYYTLNGQQYALGGLTAYPVTVLDASTWQITVTLDGSQVPDYTETTQSVRLDVDYTSGTSSESAEVNAFYYTTRNMNYSTGLANNVFIGGSTSPRFTSRVWYSYPNNPLYFPDTNYIEVGSNDTNVMGLVKVGSYLGVVKQGRTTDTSVYLAYPTSFEDDTTFAIKQEISGFGAHARYGFNIVNDETLFVSKDGIMAIEPSAETESKVRDRSFFINGKLLKEENLDKAYSIVWNNMYILCVPTFGETSVMDGVCYVLDGSQRNSWGNTKTNLVYEAYYWDNIPARSFVKYQERLCFENGQTIFRFKDDNSVEPYADNGAPVKAVWSTMLDDDGAPHYYKTLQKKGNVITLLGQDTTSAKVYYQKDGDDPIQVAELNSVQSGVPIDIFPRKKIKKYKRLKIIIKNENAEAFGVDQIVKSYVIGNYAKR